MSEASSPQTNDPGRVGRGLLGHSVGAGHRALNRPSDVRTVQRLLNMALPGVSPRLEENGRSDAMLIERIKAFQLKVLHFQVGDGRVDPGGRTLAALLKQASANEAAARRPPPPAPWYDGYVHAFDNAVKTAEEDWRKLEAYFIRARAGPPATPKPPEHVKKPSPSSGGRLTEQDFVSAARRIGPNVSPILLHAFARVESGGRSGMGPNGLPVIAYEGHIFRKYTHGAYDKTHPFLSYKYKVKAGPEWQHNNKDQPTSWKTLGEASALDETAALMACSWGMFQVMGFNYRECKYSSVQDFVSAMKGGERSQLDAFISYCLRRSGMAQAMADKNYAVMAADYNGDDYGDYDRRIEHWYKTYGGK